MKIKCVKFECGVCGKVSSIQVFYNNSGEIKYARARHYLSRVNGKPQFEYHQQSLEYIQSKLRDLPIGHIGQENNVDLQKPNSASKCESWSWGWELNPYPLATSPILLPKHLLPLF
jgi:hypothetical protein